MTPEEQTAADKAAEDKKNADAAAAKAAADKAAEDKKAADAEKKKKADDAAAKAQADKDAAEKKKADEVAAKAAAAQVDADAAALKKEQERKTTQADAEAKAWMSEPVVIEGDQKLGGPFSISGTGFGTQGVLTVAGEAVKITRWTDHSIKGDMPAGLKGDVVLKVAKGIRRGQWPYVRPVVTKTTTTIVEMTTK